MLQHLWRSRLLLCSGALKVRRYATAGTDTLDAVEKELLESIEAQKRRIARIEKLSEPQTEKQWYTVAIATSIFSILCAWRMVSDKAQHEELVSALKKQISAQDDQIARCAHICTRT